MSGLFAGLAGGVLAYLNSFVLPNEAFNIEVTLRMIIATILGGPGTILGPVIGAAIFEFISTVLWSNFTQFHATLLGIVIVLVVIFLPRGVTQLFRNGRLDLGSLLENIRTNRV